MHNGCIEKCGLGILMLIAILLFFQPALLNAETETEAKLDSYFQFMPSRKADAMSGKVGIMDADSEYSYEFKAFDKLPIKLSLENEYVGIENSTEVELPAHLVGLSTGIETTLPFFNFKDTYIRFGVSPSFFSDDWDFPASSFRIPSRVFLIYQPDPKLTFIAGVAAYPEFEYDVFPILGFIYKPNDRLSFNITPERPNISYLLNEKVTLFAEAGTSFDEYEVAKDNLKNVVLQYREVHLGAGIKYKVNKFIQSSISEGVMFNRYLEYKDSLGKVDIKNGIYTEFRVVISI